MKLYFIVCCSNPMKVKIGYAKDPMKRLADMQVACPFTLELVGTLEAKSLANARELEKRAHEAFAALHVRGEWFDYNKRTARKISRWLFERHPKLGSKRI